MSMSDSSLKAAEQLTRAYDLNWLYDYDQMRYGRVPAWHRERFGMTSANHQAEVLAQVDGFAAETGVSRTTALRELIGGGEAC